MRRHLQFFVFILLLLTGIPRTAAQEETTIRRNRPGENAYFSLVTAAPGKQVWAQYGHTAIRYNDPDNQLDMVFNYGLFDFSSENFLWRFVTGATDYRMGGAYTHDFLLEYIVENRTVTEQVLNLSDSEVEALMQALSINLLPPNDVYRYNFFFNNCATQPRDIITRTLGERVVYDMPAPYPSLRAAVHHFTADYPWTRFGIDLVLGLEADAPATLETLQFAPEVLMHSFETAQITTDSLGSQPLVRKTEELYPYDASLEETKLPIPGPVLVFWLLFAISFWIGIRQWKRGKHSFALDAMWFSVAGLAGVIIAFLWFFSSHPTTDSNYNIFILHPFHLLYALCLLIPGFRKKAAKWYLNAHIPLFVLGLAGFFVFPQPLHPALIPITLTLLSRSVMGFLTLRKTTSAS